MELSKAPRHVQSVLKAASPSGPHTALLRWCLQSINYDDMAVVDCLLEGFPLVGDIPVAVSAEAKVVRQASHGSEGLVKAGRQKRDLLAHRQAGSLLAVTRRKFLRSIAKLWKKSLWVA